MEQKDKSSVFSDFVTNPVQVITLDQLAETHRENYPDGSPVGGIYHFQLIQAILENLERRNIVYTIDDIFCAQNRFRRSPGVSILPDVAAREGEGSCASHILRRVFCNISLYLEPSMEGVGYNLALSYTQSGILLGMGPYVYACKNQSIMHADKLISNYTVRGSERLTTEARTIPYFMHKVETALDEIEKSWEDDAVTVNYLMAAQATSDDLRKLCGMLLEDHGFATTDNPLYHKNYIPSLTINMISDFVQRCINKGYFNTDNDFSFWDLLNAGNYGMKPGEIPFENIAPQSLALTKMFLKYLQRESYGR